MILHIGMADCSNYRILLDGVDVSAECVMADDKRGIAFFRLRFNENCFAYTQDLPADWPAEIPDGALLYQRTGNVEIVRET